MKIWILVAIAVALLVWGLVREPFEATQSIKAPPYDDAEQDRIWAMLSSADRDVLTNSLKQTTPGGGLEDRAVIRRTAGAVETFFTTVFKPATTPITQEQIDKFVEPMTPPDTKEPLKRLLTAYFINQSGVGSSSASGYADALKELGQGPGYLGGQGGVNTLTGTTAGGSTGGSSVTSAAPNSGSASNRKVFGPVYTSKGTPIAGGGLDTSKTNQYPELMGGGLPDKSVRTDSGIQNPSQSWLLSQSGALPSTASLGSDVDSRFLPTSRVPGDQDLIPDPYRLSKNYSTASYTSKTEPVPFLTDFSAFLK